jgi:lipoprotein NlpD
VLVLAIALALGLAACSGLPPDYGGSAKGTYKVRKGDTLYSIAFRYGLDYKSLASINRIGPPYTIYANQVLRLKGTAKLPEQDHGPVKPASKKTARPVASKPPPIAPVAAWRWPVKGRVLAPFSLKNPVNKGIDIAGREGERVMAAADGIVVYAGGNLRGYGKLVIVKHNDNFLSAYGNNQSLLVEEGQFVSAGKPIAQIGVSSDNVAMLHFEIRRDGKPENPLRYLPRTGT